MNELRGYELVAALRETADDMLNPDYAGLMAAAANEITKLIEENRELDKANYELRRKYENETLPR